MSIDSSMDKMLQRRQEVEAQLSRSAELSNKQLADFSRELSELRPVCDQIELVRQLEGLCMTESSFYRYSKLLSLKLVLLLIPLQV